MSTVFEPFFLESEAGRCFCVYRGPEPDKPCLGAYVHVPAFGEEMNKARRMTALQARAFASSGVASLQIDLFGTGDSDGEFQEARWDIWQRDVHNAVRWLASRTETEVGLWGLRLGATLACCVSHMDELPLAHLILWQPVVRGESLLTQLFRMRIASEMLGGDASGVDTKQMREQLLGGQSMELSGYLVAPNLARTLASLRLRDYVPLSARCSWLEVGAAVDEGVAPASRTVVDAWRSAGASVSTASVAGEPFWATTEIAECPALIAETTRVGMCLARVDS